MTPGILGTAVSVLGAYRYPFIFLGALVEGPVLMMASGFLLHLGTFSFLPLYFSLLLGDFVADMIWYWVGRNAAEPFLRRFGHMFGVTREMFLKMESLFRKHDTKILFISKITMGFGFALATLMAAGAARVPFKKYVVLNLLGGFIWAGLLMSIGYFFGNVYTLVDAGLRWAFVGAAIVIAIFALRGFMYFIRQKYGASNV